MNPISDGPECDSVPLTVPVDVVVTLTGAFRRTQPV